ncbi:MAG: hypothetical protein ACLQVN_18365 [Bryobacteraceae bacterium]
MLYDSTKLLLSRILRSLENCDQVEWDDQAQLGGECVYEMHQMARPQYRGYRTHGPNQAPVLVPVSERAARAIPHMKSMVRAIRRRDQAAALDSGKAALAEM